MALGFSESHEGDACSRLLRAERGSFAIQFQAPLICARLERPDASIGSVYPIHDEPNAFTGRDEVYNICDGHCVAQFQRSSVKITTRDGVQFQFRQDTPLFMRKAVKKDWTIRATALFAVVTLSKLIYGGQRKLFSVLLIACALKMSSYESSLPPYRMEVKRFGRGRPAMIEGYSMLNFSRHLVRRGKENCVIYICNALVGVRNLRTFTQCDVLSFRVESVERSGREVRKNWLKVLVGIWLATHTQYERLVYIDRDLIINEDPLNKVKDLKFDVLFPDLGGGRPDSAMFMAQGSGGLKFLKKWLSMETGVTERRDGGEEQEALLEMHRKMSLPTHENLYQFQCGRNGLNRAQCLQKEQLLEWNGRLVSTKLTFELARLLYAHAWPTKAWLVMPAVAVNKLAGGTAAETAMVVLNVLEVVAYERMFRKRRRPVKCSMEGTKAISHGSFDNPVEGSLTGVFQRGVAKRGDLGWTCFEMSRGVEGWAKWRIGEVESFLLAQLIIVAASSIGGIKHLLSTGENLKASSKKD